ncbi:MAG: glycosyl transferase family 2 [Marmoricola sp.]|nr:glycosyl transferase family 2 [Marmoricola sp.]
MATSIWRVPTRRATASPDPTRSTSVGRLRGGLAKGRARWLWQPDKWDRLSAVARLAQPAGTVADVGGRGHELRGLLPGRRVTSVNIEEPCDVLVPAGRLPFPDSAFDAVTSTDVIEHVPAGQRAGHIAELVRVAGERVVICFPCGSETKDASEQRLGARLDKEYGVRFDFLDEHLLHGLPRVDDVVAAVRRAAPDASLRVEYQDGVIEAEQLLLDAVSAVKGRKPRAALRSARSWLVRRRPTLTTRQSEDNNRAYVVIDLAKPAPR